MRRLIHPRFVTLVVFTSVIVLLTARTRTRVFNAMTTPPSKMAEIPVGLDPESVAINPSAPRAYVANAYSGTVSVIDLNALVVTNTITVGAEPMGVAVSPNGTRLYVANSSSNTVLRHTEEAAFIVGNGAGGFIIVRWPASAELDSARWTGLLPGHVVAIVHAHPNWQPLPSGIDIRTAQRGHVPVYVVTQNAISKTSGGSPEMVLSGDWRVR
jgi:YVTN family beta-propeller protein